MKPFHFLSNAVRAPEIIAILVRWGFEDLLIQLDTPNFLLKNLVRDKVAHLSTNERIRNALEELGPTFVKFGQIVGTRPDKLPQALLVELKKLRSEVEPQPLKRIQPILLKELDRPIEDVFEDFPENPVASGSLGQVYRAKLKESGEWVCVKVQRADAAKTINADFEIIGWFARQIHHRFEGLRPYNLPSLVDEAYRRVKEELDFRNEARNAETFQTMNENPERVFAPAVFGEFTTKRLLITEWVEGQSPDKLAAGTDLAKELARIGGESVFHQIVVAGFFHSDPHSGNMLVTPDNRICLLDWGQVGQITRMMRYNLADLFAGITARNPDKVVDVAERISTSNRPINRSKIEQAVTLLLNRSQKVGPAGTEIGEIGLEFIHTFGTNGIDVPPDYALLAKAILCVEETAKSLDPDFNIQDCAKPYLIKLNRERWNPKTIIRQNFWPLLRALKSLEEIPTDFQRLIRRFEEEDVQINLNHTGTEDLQDTFRNALNRLTVGVVTGALIVGSSLVITTGVQPLLWGYPAIGLLGFLASGCLGFYLVISILRRGRH
ncbi:MAG: AarF/UbiB family protein [Verrucomicrobiota bacterium]